MGTGQPDTEVLIEQAANGNALARSRLLERHRGRLRRLVAARMDRRVAARVDASDVVQESLTEAAGSMSAYLRRRALPFYPWLRQIARDRMIALHRRHVRARSRSVLREEAGPQGSPDGPDLNLAARLATTASSPSRRLARGELRDQVRAAIHQLSETDRQILVLRHLESLETSEISGLLGISPNAVRARHVRAIAHLRQLLECDDTRSEPKR